MPAFSRTFFFGAVSVGALQVLPKDLQASLLSSFQPSTSASGTVAVEAWNYFVSDPNSEEKDSKSPFVQGSWDDSSSHATPSLPRLQEAKRLFFRDSSPSLLHLKTLDCRPDPNRGFALNAIGGLVLFRNFGGPNRAAVLQETWVRGYETDGDLERLIESVEKGENINILPEAAFHTENRRAGDHDDLTTPLLGVSGRTIQPASQFSFDQLVARCSELLVGQCDVVVPKKNNCTEKDLVVARVAVQQKDGTWRVNDFS